MNASSKFRELSHCVFNIKSALDSYKILIQNLTLERDVAIVKSYTRKSIAGPDAKNIYNMFNFLLKYHNTKREIYKSELTIYLNSIIIPKVVKPNIVEYVLERCKKILNDIPPSTHVANLPTNITK